MPTKTASTIGEGQVKPKKHLTRRPKPGVVSNIDSVSSVKELQKKDALALAELIYAAFKKQSGGKIKDGQIHD